MSSKIFASQAVLSQSSSAVLGYCTNNRHSQQHAAKLSLSDDCEKAKKGKNLPHFSLRTSLLQPKTACSMGMTDDFYLTVASLFPGKIVGIFGSGWSRLVSQVAMINCSRNEAFVDNLRTFRRNV